VKLPTPLLEGTLLKRYKRFLADVQLHDGRTVTAHTPNTGSMQQCAVPGYPVLLSEANDPKRKLAFTLELIEVNGHWVDTNTQRANRVVGEGLRTGRVPGLVGYEVTPEYRHGDSRLDFMLASPREKVLLEVKNVTLLDAAGHACFPDAVTVRGQKHLLELTEATRQGWRAVIFFLVQRREAKAFTPADHIDPEYGRLLRQALASGVEAIAMQTRVSRDEVVLDTRIPVEV
jgi:sugar fermentation stimulation protein A